MWRLSLFLPRCVVFVAAVALVLLTSAVEAADGAPANLFPDPGFDQFTGDVPEGWTFDSWNQPAMKVRWGSPARKGRAGPLPGNPARKPDECVLDWPVHQRVP